MGVVLSNCVALSAIKAEKVSGWPSANAFVPILPIYYVFSSCAKLIAKG
jgi:hypothetical protein